MFYGTPEAQPFVTCINK